MATHPPVPADLHAEPAAPGPISDIDRQAELEHARRLAERYRLEFVDMDTFRIDQDLFRSIPAELMLRYGFVPYRREGRSLVIVVSDPTDIPMIDELAVILATPIKMVEVGESTGALQEMLNSLAEFYDEEIETELARFITLIEPIILVIMGVVIAMVVLALYMPLFELSSVIS